MQVHFSHSKPVNKHTSTFYFASQKPFHYLAGQFTEISLPHAHPDNRGTKRWFTLSSSPTEELLAITTAPLKNHFSTKKKET
jgi:ferredoxin-NADP reductase